MWWNRFVYQNYVVIIKKEKEMSYPWDLEARADVSIDADEVLEYVRSNKEWFLEQLSDYKSNETMKNDVKDLGNYVDSIIDKYNKVRILRDTSINNADDPRVKIYEDLVRIRRSIDDVLK